MQLRSFTESDAAEICTWRYPSPYDVYDTPDWNIVREKGWGMADTEKRAAEFYAAEEEGHLLGFFRLHFWEGDLMLGVGLRPDACGQGRGKELLSLAIHTAWMRYDALPLFLEVRAFNLRAIRCYERAGFTAIGTFERLIPAGTVQFTRMMLLKDIGR